MSKTTRRGTARGAGGERSEVEAPRAAAHRKRPGRRTAAERKQAVLQLLAGKATVGVSWRWRPWTTPSARGRRGHPGKRSSSGTVIGLPNRF